ncbi:MAG: 30S ribosomal protein S17 [Myxococcales bacterium]|jgi:small subunit ribosomal protein S17|nr:30S ribosomal protein S17 [Myxococcales bacterium]
MSEQSSERGRGKQLTGRVVSNKMQKTIVVEVTTRVKNPQYMKYVTRAKRYKAHDESNDCGIGDVVTIQECRPMSADKRFRLLTVKERAAQ